MKKTAGKDSTVKIIEREADYEKTKYILNHEGLRLLKYQEALVRIDKDANLKKQLKGKWFYLDGKGPNESGYHTFDDKGNLTEGKGNIEKTVYAWKGNNPLSLGVHADDFARDDERRFGLDAYDEPHDVAPVVVGVEVSSPKINKVEDQHIHRYICRCGHTLVEA